MERARARGLDVIALTDHDTVGGLDEARAALPPGLTLVPGMELSATLDGRSLHLLAYLFDPAYPPLAEAVASIRDDRVRRARVMVDKLAALGTGVTWDQVTAIAGDGVVGRPHIARALADTGTISAPADAFTTDWIGDGGRAWEDKYAMDTAEAIALIGQAGGCWRPGSGWCPPAAATTTARSPAITSGPRPPRPMPSSASPPRPPAASRRYPP